MSEIDDNVKHIREYMCGIEENQGADSSQIKKLKKYRAELLDDIHTQQQCLDSIDYMLYKIRNKNN
ncbi:MAG: hypothetical protein LUC92_06340 [Clostridiales bacterium]|nr:hypothetical protein [Clostridiales bacterium]